MAVENRLAMPSRATATNEAMRKKREKEREPGGWTASLRARKEVLPSLWHTLLSP
jgi:hypothetical protein